jgi:hypothetical protein
VVDARTKACCLRFPSTSPVLTRLAELSFDDAGMGQGARVFGQFHLEVDIFVMSRRMKD